jgi:hypothetical protein
MRAAVFSFRSGNCERSSASKLTTSSRSVARPPGSPGEPGAIVRFGRTRGDPDHLDHQEPQERLSIFRHRPTKRSDDDAFPARWRGHPDLIEEEVLDERLAHREIGVALHLIRAEFTPAEIAIHITRRKELYEKLHPETTHGANRYTRKKSSLTENSKPFVIETARKTGEGRSTIAKAATRGKKVLADITGKIPEKYFWKFLRGWGGGRAKQNTTAVEKLGVGGRNLPASGASG